MLSNGMVVPQPVRDSEFVVQVWVEVVLIEISFRLLGVWNQQYGYGLLDSRRRGSFFMSRAHARLDRSKPLSEATKSLLNYDPGRGKRPIERVDSGRNHCGDGPDREDGNPLPRPRLAARVRRLTRRDRRGQC